MDTELFLWAGLNQEAIALDEVNGGGINHALDVLMHDCMVLGRPLVESEGIWATISASPDYELRLATVPRENRIVEVT